MAQEWAVLYGLACFLAFPMAGRLSYWWMQRVPNLSHLGESVKAGTPEYAEAKEWAHKLLALPYRWSHLDKMVNHLNPMKPFMGHHFFKKLPKPFSCTDLEFVPTEGGGIVWFCGRLGCLCSPAREDLEGDYPTFCPDPDERFWMDDYEDEDADWEADYCDSGEDYPEDEAELDEVEYQDPRDWAEHDSAFPEI